MRDKKRGGGEVRGSNKCQAVFFLCETIFIGNNNIISVGVSNLLSWGIVTIAHLSQSGI